MKKQFRITLFDGATSLCEKLVTMAAYSNGDRGYTLAQLKTVAEANILEFPTLNEKCQVELIGETILHIDKQFKEGAKTVLVIEEIEVIEIPNLVDEEEGVLYGV